MRIAEIWRYPVKSMGGERLQRAPVTPLGIAGDRIVHVEDAYGNVVTSRTYPRLLGHHATLDASGQPLVDGVLWTDSQATTKVVDIVGPGARLVYDESPQRFDILPLLVATDGAIKAFGRDGRRLRPNIVIGDVEGLAEREWEGQCLRIGEVVIGIQDLRMRCVMTTFDPDTQRQDREVLRDIVRRFDGKLALNCYVIQPGEIHEGEDVELIPHCETLQPNRRWSETAPAKEHLRARYRPTSLRMLFVGESPPASGRFFYQADSGLYRAMRSAFIGALPQLESANFLDAFHSLGCYLVDLCGKPVDRLENEDRRAACLRGEVRLSKMVAELQPEIVVTLVRSIAPHVRRALVSAHWNGEQLELPYPGRWQRNRVAFAAALIPILQREFANDGFSRRHGFAQNVADRYAVAVSPK